MSDNQFFDMALDMASKTPGADLNVKNHPDVDRTALDLLLLQYSRTQSVVAKFIAAGAKTSDEL